MVREERKVSNGESNPSEEKKQVEPALIRVPSFGPSSPLIVGEASPPDDSSYDGDVG